MQRCVATLGTSVGVGETCRGWILGAANREYWLDKLVLWEDKLDNVNAVLTLMSVK